jgi:hypothetical protein
MSPTITYLLMGCFFLLAVIAIYETFILRNLRLLIFQISAICILIFFLHISTGFPTPKIFFGGASPLLAILIMFVGTLMGIVAHYFFSKKESFNWQTFIKPLLVSPIIFLPSIGQVSDLDAVSPIQVITFTLIAFQNGFFWKGVFERVRNKME